MSLYGGLVIWGTATITSILSMVGIAASTNVMIWSTVVVMGGLLVSVVYQVLAFIGMNKAYDLQEAGTADAESASIMNTISSDWMTGASVNAFVGLILYGNYNNWWAAQEEAMGEEDEASALFSNFSF